jgi:hypothetical protein
MYKDRLPYYKKLESLRNSKLLVYVTGDKRGMEVQIAMDVFDFFMWHLDLIGVVDKISLFLYTKGGITSAAWSLVNLIKQFCDQEFEVIVPSKALSAGTLMCLGANSLLMTKQATLGPIDPSVNHPLNPSVGPEMPQGPFPGLTPKAPVSVEDIEGFIEHAKGSLVNKEDISQIYAILANRIHPLVLGNAFRARGQIRMLGERLISNHIHDQLKINKILDFLCSKSGSHDYTINRREARDELGLPVQIPTKEEYDVIKAIYDDISAELELSLPFNQNVILGAQNSAQYKIIRGLVESTAFGSHAFISEGTISRQRVPQLGPQEIIAQIPTRDEWTLVHSKEV